jgi:hypothetical protein
MKDPWQLLHAKQQELTRVKKEVDALRTVAKLLGEGDFLADPQAALPPSLGQA